MFSRERFIKITPVFLILLSFVFLLTIFSNRDTNMYKKSVLSDHESKNSYWLLLHRKSNKEELFRGVPGDTVKSKFVKNFVVKSGIPGERPTPLPKLLGRKYWIITEKHEEVDNPETAPYFLTLNIPAPSEEPYGPSPYNECNGQCYWNLPGSFGLHGTANDKSKLSKEDPGSSGCIRHSNEDIAYLYNLLNPSKEEIRYYIEDN